VGADRRDLDGVGFKVVAWMDSQATATVVTGKAGEDGGDLKGSRSARSRARFIAASNAMAPTRHRCLRRGLHVAAVRVLDGMEHGAATIVSTKIFEVTKHGAHGTCSGRWFRLLEAAWDGYTERSAAILAAAAVRDHQRRCAARAGGLDVLKQGHTIQRSTPSSASALPLQDDPRRHGARTRSSQIRETKPARPLGPRQPG
jgi:hypothetical protein